MRPFRKAPVRSILIVKLSSLGDVLLASAVLSYMRACFPDAAIDWVVEAGGAEILRDNRALRRVLIFPRAAIQSALPWRYFRARRIWRAFIHELRAERYDLVLDLQGLARSWAVSLAARLAPDGARAGKGRFPFIRYKSPHKRKYLRHALPSYFEIFHVLGFASPPPEQICLSFAPVQEGEEQAERFEVRNSGGELPSFALALGREGQAERFGDRNSGGKLPYVIFHAFTTWRSKHWPEGHWVRLALLCKARGLRVIISGAAADGARAEALLAQIRLAADSIEAASAFWAQSAAGRLDFAGFAALARTAYAVISVDSFPMHLAAASRAWVISLHGPTDPARTGPWGERCRALTAAGVSCPMRGRPEFGISSAASSLSVPCKRAPCRKRSCRDTVCMRGITPESVLAALDDAFPDRAKRL